MLFGKSIGMVRAYPCGMNHKKHLLGFSILLMTASTSYLPDTAHAGRIAKFREKLTKKNVGAGVAAAFMTVAPLKGLHASDVTKTSGKSVKIEHHQGSNKNGITLTGKRLTFSKLLTTTDNKIQETDTLEFWASGESVAIDGPGVGGDQIKAFELGVKTSQISIGGSGLLAVSLRQSNSKAGFESYQPGNSFLNASIPKLTTFNFKGSMGSRFTSGGYAHNPRIHDGPVGRFRFTFSASVPISGADSLDDNLGLKPSSSLEPSIGLTSQNSKLGQPNWNVDISYLWVKKAFHDSSMPHDIGSGFRLSASKTFKMKHFVDGLALSASATEQHANIGINFMTR